MERKIWARIVKYWAMSILWIGNIPYKIIGLEKLDPNQQYVFASNHESAFDIPLTLAGIPWHVVPIAKKRIKKNTISKLGNACCWSYIY